MNRIHRINSILPLRKIAFQSSASWTFSAALADSASLSSGPAANASSRATGTSTGRVALRHREHVFILAYRERRFLKLLKFRCEEATRCFRCAALRVKIRAVKKPGDINRNSQQLLRLTGERGTDHNSRIWILKCLCCGHVYGSNSTDAFERKCPNCQRGTAGLRVPTERDGRDWTREEHILAFQLYNRIPFGRIHMRNPEIIELAALLGRKVGSVSRKLANFSRLDPVHRARHVHGLEHGARGEEEVWKEFAEHPEALAFESARLLAERLGRRLEEVAEIEQADLPPPGAEREAVVKLRVNQAFFRQRVLSAYEFRCCVTGLNVRPLLVASHIIPWAEDPANRLNPRNGLCLNALHDRAFERGLMWIEPNFVIRLSRAVREATTAPKQTLDWLLSFDGKRLLLPSNFQPDEKLLAKHAARWGRRP